MAKIHIKCVWNLDARARVRDNAGWQIEWQSVPDVVYGGLNSPEIDIIQQPERKNGLFFIITRMSNYNNNNVMSKIAFVN